MICCMLSWLLHGSCREPKPKVQRNYTEGTARQYRMQGDVYPQV